MAALGIYDVSSQIPPILLHTKNFQGQNYSHPAVSWHKSTSSATTRFIDRNLCRRRPDWRIDGNKLMFCQYRNKMEDSNERDLATIPGLSKTLCDRSQKNIKNLVWVISENIIRYYIAIENLIRYLKYCT